MQKKKCNCITYKLYRSPFCYNFDQLVKLLRRIVSDVRTFMQVAMTPYQNKRGTRPSNREIYVKSINIIIVYYCRQTEVGFITRFVHNIIFVFVYVRRQTPFIENIAATILSACHLVEVTMHTRSYVNDLGVSLM